MSVEEALDLVELRNYRIVAGRALDFLEHFEREDFPSALARCGIEVLGHFVAADDPDRFVWLRAFPEAARRATSLDQFYTSAYWMERRRATNELLVEYDDVLLMRPAGVLSSGMPRSIARRVEGPLRDGFVLALAFPLPGPGGELPPSMRSAMTALARRHGAVRDLGRLVTAHVPNDYPRLPVRDDLDVVLWLLGGDDHSYLDGLSADARAALGAPAIELLLRPGSLSRLP